MRGPSFSLLGPRCPESQTVYLVSSFLRLLFLRPLWVSTRTSDSLRSQWEVDFSEFGPSSLSYDPSSVSFIFRFLGIRLQDPDHSRVGTLSARLTDGPCSRGPGRGREGTPGPVSEGKSTRRLDKPGMGGTSPVILRGLEGSGWLVKTVELRWCGE